MITLSLFKAREGFRSSFDCFEGIISIGQYIDGFVCEPNSDEMPEHDKCQRDVTRSRTSGIESYTTIDVESEGESAFTGVVIFVNQAQVLQSIPVGDETAVVLSIADTASTHITDGQGRHTAFSSKVQKLLESGEPSQVERLRARTLGLKLIVTNTDSVLDAKDAIRTFFASIHLNLKKPATSLSLFFSDDPLSRLMRSVSIKSEVGGRTLYDRLSTTKTLSMGQIMDYGHFRTLICRMLGASPKSANAALSDSDVFDAYESIFSKLLVALYSRIDVSGVDEHDYAKYRSSAMYNKALVIGALGAVCRSLIETAGRTSTKIDLTKLDALSDLPLGAMNDSLWIENGIVTVKPNGSVTITPKSESVIALLICDKLNIEPSAALTKYRNTFQVPPAQGDA